MSQAKVDRYKEEKKNRAKIIKKEKRQLLAMKLGASVVAVALVAWFSVSVYHGFQLQVVSTTVEVKLAPLTLRRSLKFF